VFQNDIEFTVLRGIQRCGKKVDESKYLIKGVYEITGDTSTYRNSLLARTMPYITILEELMDG
jgi:hypothetical protein